MQQTMSISVNGQSQVPPGFRFHPTEEELLLYYLRKKVSYEKIDLDVIRDVDLNKLEPWDIQVKCKIGSTPQNDWYFFSHKDKKYPTGTRTNRATAAGFWKATGRDKVIHGNSRRIGMRKTLVFYTGRAPHGQKSDWIMHEYRLDDINTTDTNINSNVSNYTMGEAMQEGGWVVCRIFKKKNYQKTLDSPMSSSMMISSTTSETGTTSQRTLMMSSRDEGTLEQILHEYVLGGSRKPTCKEEEEEDDEEDEANIESTALNINYGQFMKLPSLSLENPNSCYPQLQMGRHDQTVSSDHQSETSLNDWVALDRLVASHLMNAQTESTSKQLSTSGFFTSDHHSLMGMTPISSSTFYDINDDHEHIQLQAQVMQSSSSSNPRTYHTAQDYNNEFELWSFSRSSSAADAPYAAVCSTITEQPYQYF